MGYYKHHVFFCQNQREAPEACCANHGAAAMRDYCKGRVAGLVAGLLAFVPLRGLGRTARIYLAIVLTLAGALFAKIFGAYSALGDFLRLFSWPYGQLATFATLTRYLHESWPVLALAWLCALFVWRRDEPLQ